MSNPIFTFKKFVIRQDKCLMKISTDSVLIGAWVDPSKAKRILDVGTGTGIIALMLAQRSSAKIDALDICSDGCTQAQENFSGSEWSERIKVHCTALQEFSSNEKYDIIVSNPPFFTCPKTHKEINGAQAWFTHKLSFAELAFHVIRLLSKKGSFYIILPVHEGAYFTNEAEKRNLFLVNYTWVKTTTRKKFPKRILMRFEFVRQSSRDDRLLIIQNDNNYTDDYKELTKDYYLHF